jgi:hypothetical protein
LKKAAGKRGDLRHIHNIIDVIAHGDKEIEKQLPPHLHFHLHRPTALERLPAADDESEVMGAQPRVGVWRVLVREARTAEDGGDLDAALQALLAQGEPLELLEAIPVRGAVHGRVAENDVADASVEDCRLDGDAAAVGGGGGVGGLGEVGRDFERALEHPGLAPLVVQQARVVVAFVQILKHAREDLGFFEGEIEAPVGGWLEELVLQRRREERRVTQYVFVRGEQALVRSHYDGDDGRSQIRRYTRRSYQNSFQGHQVLGTFVPLHHGTVHATVHFLDHPLLLARLSKRPLRLLLGDLVRAILGRGSKRALKHVGQQRRAEPKRVTEGVQKSVKVSSTQLAYGVEKRELWKPTTQILSWSLFF